MAHIVHFWLSQQPRYFQQLNSVCAGEALKKNTAAMFRLQPGIPTSHSSSADVFCPHKGLFYYPSLLPSFSSPFLPSSPTPLLLFSPPPPSSSEIVIVIH